MDCFERYYRRSYNTLNKLIEVYKNGYDKDKTLKFRQELISKYKSNPKVAQSEFNNLMFTTLIALLGLNKEAIENTGKISEYKMNNNTLDISSMPLSSEQRLRLKEFNDSKVISTDFDDWLSIKINPNTDKDNIDYLRRIRNSLLHSNFYIDEETDFMPITKLKTKSYYEAELFNMQFQLFVFEYFANIDGLGLVESMYTFNVPKMKIRNKKDLEEYLNVISINKISYENLKTVGVNSPELNLKDCSNEKSYVDVDKFVDKLKNNTNADNIKNEVLLVDKKHITDIINYIKNIYGDSFYKLDCDTQGGIITTHLKYELNPKIELSNWMIHFWYLYSTLGNGKFFSEFLDGDEFGTESCYPALMVLKSYLLMYRLQHNNFDEIDYNKVDFNKNDFDILLYSDVVDPSITKEDFFQKSFDKEKSKGVLTTDTEIWNKIICEVVRDSLAHGNIRTFTGARTQEPFIELKDIDQKKGTMRAIILPLTKYKSF